MAEICALLRAIVSDSARANIFGYFFGRFIIMHGLFLLVYCVI